MQMHSTEASRRNRLPRAIAAVAALTVLATASVACSPRGMTPVPETDGLCPSLTTHGGYCSEWKLVSDSTLRIVAHGFEDGGRTELHRRDAQGRYALVANLYPVFERPGRPGSYHWAYTWDIDDVVVQRTPEGPRLQATLVHDAVDDGNAGDPGRTTPVPLVLFTGTTSQPQMIVRGDALSPMSVEALQRNEAAGIAAR